MPPRSSGLRIDRPIGDGASPMGMLQSLGLARVVPSIAAPSTAVEFGDMFHYIASRLKDALDKDDLGGPPENFLTKAVTGDEGLLQRLEAIEEPLTVLARSAAVWMVTRQAAQEQQLRRRLPVVQRLAQSGLVSVIVCMLRSSHFEFARSLDRDQAAANGSRWRPLFVFEQLLQCACALAAALQHIAPDVGRRLYDELLTGGLMQLIAEEMLRLPSAAGVQVAGASPEMARTTSALAAASAARRREIIDSSTRLYNFASRAAAQAVKFPEQGLAVLQGLRQHGCIRSAVRAAKALRRTGMAEAAATVMLMTVHTLREFQNQEHALGAQGQHLVAGEADDPAVLTALLAVVHGVLLRLLDTPLRIKHVTFQVEPAAFPDIVFLRTQAEDALEGLARVLPTVSPATQAKAVARLDVLLLVLSALKGMTPVALHGWKAVRVVYALLPESDRQAALPSIMYSLETCTLNTVTAARPRRGPDDGLAAPRDAAARAAAGAGPSTRAAGSRDAQLGGDLSAAQRLGSDATQTEAQAEAAAANLQHVESKRAGVSVLLERRGPMPVLHWLHFLSFAFEFVHDLTEEAASGEGTHEGGDEHDVLTCRNHAVLRCVEAVLRGVPQLHALHLWALKVLVPLPADSTSCPPAGRRSAELEHLRLWARLTGGLRLASVLLTAVKFVRTHAAAVLAPTSASGASDVAGTPRGLAILAASRAACGDGLPLVQQMELVLAALHRLCLLTSRLRGLEARWGAAPPAPPPSRGGPPAASPGMVQPPAAAELERLLALLPLAEARPAGEVEEVAAAVAEVRRARCFLSRQLLVEGKDLMSRAYHLARRSTLAMELWRNAALELALVASGAAAEALLDAPSAEAALSFLSNLMYIMHGGDRTPLPLDEDTATAMQCAALCTLCGLWAQGLLLPLLQGESRHLMMSLVQDLVGNLRKAAAAVGRRTSLSYPAGACALMRHVGAVTHGRATRGMTPVALSVASGVPCRLIDGGEVLSVGAYWSLVLSQVEGAVKAGRGAAVADTPAAPAPVLRASSHLQVCSNPACVNLDGDCELLLKLTLCKRCQGTRYCSTACRRAHLGVHKLACAATAAARPQASTTSA